MSEGSRTLLLCFFIACGAGRFTPAAVAADPAQTVGDLLGKEDATHGSAPAALTPERTLVRLAISLAVILVAGTGGLLLLRRLRGRRLLGHQGTVEVVGHTSLSHKHSVYLVRLGEGRVAAVGITGDRMTPLALLDSEELSGTAKVERGTGAAVVLPPDGFSSDLPQVRARWLGSLRGTLEGGPSGLGVVSRGS